MGKVTYQDGIAVIQIVVFAPALAAAIISCFRHGISKAGGSLLLVSFLCTRMTGAICQLASITSPSTGLLTAELVCLYIGLSPLTLVCWGVLQRVNEQALRQLPRMSYRLMTVVSLTGLCLGIYGAIKASQSWTDGVAKWNAFSKAAVIIFTCVFGATVLAYLFLLKGYHSTPLAERRIFPAVAVCIPLIAVRLAYALVGEWSGVLKWNPFFGNHTIYLCMAVIEECIIVVVLVVTLFSLPRLNATQYGTEKHSSRRGIKSKSGVRRRKH